MSEWEDVMMANTAKSQQTYHEVKFGRTLYRVTSFYSGEVNLDKALEDLTVKKVLQTAAPLLTT
ncbi:MAG: hypothetical protein LBC86_10090 [Oscillospiraceae bacterium]|nr:hypothetical protein [Oscillospiraceae bacterium]